MSYSDHDVNVCHDTKWLRSELLRLRSDNEAKGKEIEELKVSVEDWKKIGKAHIVHLKEDEFRSRLKGVWDSAIEIVGRYDDCSPAFIVEKLRDESIRSRSTDPAEPQDTTARREGEGE